MNHLTTPLSLAQLVAVSTPALAAADRSSDTQQVDITTRRGAVHVKHDGNGNFVSHDGRFNLQFGIDQRGQTELMTLTLPASWP